MFGSHIKTTSVINAAKKIHKYGGNIFQIMLPKDQTDTEEIKKYLLDNNIKVVIHSSYTYNIAISDPWFIDEIVNEIKYASKIGAYGVVIHFGKSKDLNLSVAYNNMYINLLKINSLTSDYSDVLLLLETTSSQGSELCSKLEDLALFFNKLKFNKRFKLCIDTCHIFQAGYDIRNKDSFKLYLEAFEELIGLNKVGLIHLNDSLEDIGGRRDRHQNIGKGYIGYTGLMLFYKYFKNKVPIILETPNKGYKTEIKLLKDI